MKKGKTKKNKIGKMIIAVVTLTILSVVVYSKVIIPKKYTGYINEGNQYLSEEKYEGAIEAFQNALEINKDSVEAKLGQAEGYMGINNIDKAKNILISTIEKDIKNENLLMDILGLLSDLDLEFSNELISNYIDKIGLDNVSDKFRSEIVEYTDRNEMNLLLKSAEELYNKSVEGQEEGQYEVGSKEVLLGIINEGKKFNKNYLINQSEVDTMTKRLNESIATFKAKVIKPFPVELINSYKARLAQIERETENAYNNLDLCNAEMGDVLYNAQEGYEGILREIYSDLYKYMPANKKSQVELDENNYKIEKEKVQYDFDNMDPMMMGTWLVQGIPEAFGDLAKENCYYLINKYMK